MAFLDKLTKVTQDAVRGTKDFTDVARQKSLIADEQKQIANLYSQIGKLYYETTEANPDTPIGKLCLAITASTKRIAKHEEEIRQIKGTKRCPSCNADIPLASSFCGVCGTKIEVDAEPQVTNNEIVQKFCKACGAEIATGTMFCTSCGHKQ